MNYRLKKFFKYFTNYKLNLSLTIVCNIFYAILSFFSLGLIAPFIGVIFGVVEDVKTLPLFSFDINVLLSYAYYYVGLIRDTYGIVYSLCSVVIIFVLLSIVANLFRYLNMFFMAGIRASLVEDLRNDFYKELLNLPMSFFSQRKRGDLLSRATNDMNEVEWAVVTSIQGIFKEPLLVIIYLGVLYAINPPLLIFALLFLPLVVYLISKIGGLLTKDATQAQERLGNIMTRAEESIYGVRIIKSYNLKDYVLTQFKEYNNIYVKKLNTVYRKRDLADPLTEFILIILMLIIIGIGGWQIFAGKLRPDLFILFILLFARVLPPAKATVMAYFNFQKGLAAMNRIYEVMEMEDTVKESLNPISKTEFTNIIEYKNVCFKYIENNNYVLKDINLNINKGGTYAFVGHSGSGKTTCADLLSRFYDIDNGAISIDGVDIKDLKLKDLRSMIGMVSQHSFIWHDTIANNICFGQANFTRDQIIEAAKKANAHEFIMQLSNKYDTVLGDMGMTVSGGQRQRIAIARAVLKNAPILVLDEATSALDTESEVLVQQALKELMKGRTTIIIAHRLSTIHNANCIFVFEEGEIVEQGTHNELLDKGGIYSNLVDLQQI